MRIVFLCLLSALLLGGCLVGPNYSPPDNTVGETWITEAPEDSLYEEPPTLWWELFNDCLLNKYIEMAALNNNDLLAAETAIWEARAMKQVAASYLFPHVGADLDALRTHFSKNGPILALFQRGGAAAKIIPPIPPVISIYNALVDVNWEIDIFGKRRRGVEAAVANIGSAIEQRNQILISIFAEVALNYVELRSNQKRVVLVEENIALLEKNVAVVQKQFEAGYRNRLDLERVEAALAADRANLPDIYAQIYQNIYALSILTGNLPETLLEELLPVNPMPQLPQEMAIGIRSDLLRRRPDIRQAERQLAAATANIGVAVASFFPTFHLLGAIGFQSLQLRNLFQAKSLTWGILGDVNAPIFEGGKLIGNLRISQAEAAAALFNYQQIVLNAVDETESALIAYKEEVETAGLLTEATFKYEDLVELTNQRFVKGLVNVTDLLDVEQQWNASEQNLLTSETSVLIDLIRIYKALGGGWECS